MLKAVPGAWEVPYKWMVLIVTLSLPPKSL